MESSFLYKGIECGNTPNRVNTIFKYILNIRAQLTLNIDHEEVRIGNTECCEAPIEHRVSSLSAKKAFTVKQQHFVSIFNVSDEKGRIQPFGTPPCADAEVTAQEII